MKSIKKLFVYFMMANLAVFAASCGGDDDTPEAKRPTINVNPTDEQTVAPGDNVLYQITAGADEKVQRVQTFYSTTSTTGDVPQLDSSDFNNTGNTTFNWTFNVPSSAANGTVYTVKFRVTDKKGATAETTRRVTVSTGDAQNCDTDITLGSWSESEPSFFDPETCNTYNLGNSSANQAAIDVIFYHGNQNNYTLAAPSDASFGTGQGQISSLGVQGWMTAKNATMFRMTTLGEAAYNATTGNGLKAAYDNATDATAESKEINLQGGQVVAFKTVNNNYGLIWVKNVTGGDGSGKGKMTIRSKSTK